jgi:hypothetical protein
MDNHRVLTEAESKIFEYGYNIGARFESRRCKELEREVEKLREELRDATKNALDGKNA